MKSERDLKRAMPARGVLELLETGRIIAILRGDFGGSEEDIASLLFETGITAVEVTLNSPGAFDSIQRLAARMGTQMAVGAGTVLSPVEVDRAAAAGAQFIVSPHRDRRVIEACQRLDLAAFPGCFTPSEVVEAIQAGAEAVKLFPAQCLGPEFVKAMRGPLPQVRFIPTGGVTPEAAANYLAAGAWAVGVGSELAGKDVNAPGGLGRLRLRASAFVAAVKSRPPQTHPPFEERETTDGRR